MRTRRVLVTDGEQRSALAVVRSLGGHGHEVFVASDRARSLAGASRFARGAARVASPLRDSERFVEDVSALVARWRIDTVIPVTDASVLALLEHRERLTHVTLPLASLPAYRGVSDKAQLMETAPRFGIAVPRQHTLPSPHTPLPVDLRWPLVVKPARSVSSATGERRKLNVRHVSDRAALDQVLRDLPVDAYPLLLQERIVGPGIGVFILMRDGVVCAAFSHRRIREKPPSGGVSVYRESIPIDSTLLERSRALLAHYGWEGVGMVEYKVDERTGTPYLMEINGRFWGSLQLAIDAGVDFPRLLLEESSGKVAATPLPYRTGIRSRWWWGDVDQLLTRLRRRRASDALPPEERGRLKALWEFAHLWRPSDRNEILWLSDPAPFFRESIDWVMRR